MISSGVTTKKGKCVQKETKKRKWELEKEQKMNLPSCQIGKGKVYLSIKSRGKGNLIKKENERGLLLPIQLENRKFKLPSG